MFVFFRPLEDYSTGTGYDEKGKPLPKVHTRLRNATLSHAVQRRMAGWQGGLGHICSFLDDFDYRLKSLSDARVSLYVNRFLFVGTRTDFAGV